MLDWIGLVWGSCEWSDLLVGVGEAACRMMGLLERLGVELPAVMGGAACGSAWAVSAWQ